MTSYLLCIISLEQVLSQMFMQYEHITAGCGHASLDIDVVAVEDPYPGQETRRSEGHTSDSKRRWQHIQVQMSEESTSFFSSC